MKSEPTINGNYIKNIKFHGIEVTQGSNAKIFNNTINFVRRGITTLQGVLAEISGNIIKNAEYGIYAYQVGPKEIIMANYITNCERAINCDSFSEPKIIGNHIESNMNGIVSVQFSKPEIKNNDIVGNGIGIVAYKKSEPVIGKNNIFDNDIGLFFDFSSYPIVKENNIFDNLYAIKLGIFQSADWEKSMGSAKITKKQALTKKSKVNFNKMGEKELSNFIDLQKNYWGEDVTKEMEQKGCDKNISAIYDYYDKNKVSYEGFGDTEYTLDMVKYDNWIKQKIKGCGKKEKKDEGKKKPMDIAD
jgi:parallel beta-helix repeat protein